MSNQTLSALVFFKFYRSKRDTAWVINFDEYVGSAPKHKGGTTEQKNLKKKINKNK
jgi:hypothetical protein